MNEGCEHRYQVKIKMAHLKFSKEEFPILLQDWEKRFGCTLLESKKNLILTLGKPKELYLRLKGKKGRKYCYIYSGEILGQILDEDMLMELMDWITLVQTGSDDTLGLVISRAGQQTRPIVIRNREVIDEGRMMDFLWDYYSATRIRESRRMTDIYHFLRDVPKDED